MKKVIRPNQGVRRRREKPMKLAKKLLQIREALQLSQNGLIAELELDEVIKQRNVSAWERGYREPNLRTLIKYARAANICLNVLIDDEYDLPAELPTKRTFHPHIEMSILYMKMILLGSEFGALMSSMARDIVPAF